MKKKIFNILALTCILALPACDLNLFPETSYNEGNIKVDEESESAITTKEGIKGLVDGLYTGNIKSNTLQEGIFVDGMVYGECRADNAYGGNPSTGELMAIEANKQDGENKNVKRDWSYYQDAVKAANQIICNIDRVKEADPTMTQKEYNEWKSQAICWKSYALFQMSYIWGDIPVQNSIPPAITDENLEEVYPEYFPARVKRELVFDQLIEDLTFASQNGLEPDSADKSRLNKAFAHGLLARVYAEKPRRDWTKVIEHCQAIEDMGIYELCDDYGYMWAYDENDVVRNTKESIYEIPWTTGSGHWVWMMFHRNAYSPNDSYDWIKWITPSRNLIAAYDAEGDTERKNACIVFDKSGGWSDYYPSDNYAFMHKCPTNASSIILMRLGEIYLLKAEAYAMNNQFDKATEYVNKIRTRAGVKTINIPKTHEDMIDVVLNERRLELAFEGFRFWDLVRHDKAIEIHDSMSNPSSPNYDPYFQVRRPLTNETILMPIPTEVLETNPSITQNPGY